MLSPTTEDPIKTISGICGQLLASFGFLCLRAWLLSICVGLFFPSFVLGFWQWVLVMFAFRFIIYFDNDKD
jgi:hypothetical protein